MYRLTDKDLEIQSSFLLPVSPVAAEATLNAAGVTLVVVEATLVAAGVTLVETESTLHVAV